jgi:hypothetical protein
MHDPCSTVPIKLLLLADMLPIRESEGDLPKLFILEKLGIAFRLFSLGKLLSLEFCVRALIISTQGKDREKLAVALTTEALYVQMSE